MSLSEEVGLDLAPDRRTLRSIAFPPLVGPKASA